VGGGRGSGGTLAEGGRWEGGGCVGGGLSWGWCFRKDLLLDEAVVQLCRRVERVVYALDDEAVGGEGFDG